MFATSRSTIPIPAVVSDNHIPYHVCLSLFNTYRRFYLLSPHKKVLLVLFLQGNISWESRHDICDEHYACIWHLNSIVGFSRTLIRHDVNKTRITTYLKGAERQANRRLQKCYETVHKRCLYCTEQA